MPHLRPYIIEIDSIPSTNKEALRLAQLGAAQGTCVIAREQTQGRGRESRRWESPLDAGLYFSIVLRPAVDARHWALIALLGAVAVHDTLEHLFELSCDVKWPNDIMCNAKKLCGILAERTEGAAGPAVILGIGINLTHSWFPAELAPHATAVSWENRDAIIDRGQLVRHLISELDKQYSVFNKDADFAAVISHWVERSSYAFGKMVRVKSHGSVIEGRTCGVDIDGALRIESNGKVLTIRSGDVQALRALETGNQSAESSGP